VQGQAADGAAVVGNPVRVAGKDGSGNTQDLSTDTTGRLDANLIASQAGITGGAGSVAANTPRATLASDDPAVTALQIIDDWDESDRAKVNPIVGQAGVAGGTGADGPTVQRVSLATDVALPAGNNNIGDVDVASIAAGTNTIGATRDAGAAWTQSFGVSGAVVLSSDMQTSAAVTDAPTSGQKLVIDDIMVSVSAAMFIIFEEETSGTDLLKVWFPGAGFYQITPRAKFKLATADKKLFADASAAGALAITVFYHSEA